MREGEGKEKGKEEEEEEEANLCVATVRHVGFRALRGRPPRPPLRLTSLCQTACSSGGRAKHCPPRPYGLSCAAIWRRDLRRRAALSAHPTLRAGPFRVAEQNEVM